MGKCISKQQKPKKRQESEKFSLLYYKPKSSSNSLLGCRLTDKAFKEAPVLGQLNFQSASIFRKLDNIRYICIGGLDNGEQALMINMLTSSYSQISSPPMSLAYGNVIPFENKLYVLGSLTIEASGQEKPAPPLSYDILGHRWSELSDMPGKLALCGSYIIGKDVYVLGGYLNYPDYPSHFRNMLIFDLANATWMQSNVETPILQGLPACCVISEIEVLIIGGHDPCERISDVESHSTYMFNGSTFEVYPDIPTVGQSKFLEAPIHYKGQVFIYSDDDILFIFNILNKEWSYIDCEQSMIKCTDFDELNRYHTAKTYLYRYIMEECEIVEYNLTFGVNRRTGPSSFKYSFKYTGMCILEDGRLLFAGGITEDLQATKSTWSMSPTLGSSSNNADLPFAQYGIRMVMAKNEVYAIAGIENDGDQYICRCQKYSPSSDKWEILPQMEYTAFLPGVCYYNEKIFAIGGKSENDVYFLVQALDIFKNIWEVIDIEYPVSALAIGCTNLSNKILCFGGKDPNNSLLYDSFLFDGLDFQQIQDLPDCQGEESTTFIDPVIINFGKVYAVSVEGNIFSYSNEKWEILYTSNK